MLPRASRVALHQLLLLFLLILLIVVRCSSCIRAELVVMRVAPCCCCCMFYALDCRHLHLFRLLKFQYSFWGALIGYKNWSSSFDCRMGKGHRTDKKLSDFSKQSPTLGKHREMLTLFFSGGCTHVMHVRSRMTIYPRIPTMPGRNTSGFHGPGRHCLQHQGGEGGCTHYHAWL